MLLGGHDGATEKATFPQTLRLKHETFGKLQLWPGVKPSLASESPMSWSRPAGPCATSSCWEGQS